MQLQASVLDIQHRPSTIECNNKHLDDAERVKEKLKTLTVPAAKSCLNEYVWSLHGDSVESIQKCLDRVNFFFLQLFPQFSCLNTTTKSYKLLKFSETERAIDKANCIYSLYKEICINESLLKLPKYLCEKYDFEENDKPLLDEIFKSTLASFKTEILEPEFDLFHRPCALRVIHYALGIPSSDPRSHISSVVCLNLDKL